MFLWRSAPLMVCLRRNNILPSALWFQVWRFLLGYHSYDSTYAERKYLMSIRKSEYETIKNQWKVCVALSRPFFPGGDREVLFPSKPLLFILFDLSVFGI